ncbi:MAG: hypothetical protein KGZ50_02880 [Peptococcaceae bacterium]|nr:hypothetical protein [Peptococcaceae bacterium]
MLVLKHARVWGSSLVLMLLSLLVAVWIFGPVGFMVHNFSDPVYVNLAYSMVPHILLVVPASLALASRKISGILIALPYVLLLSYHLLAAFMNMALGADATAVARAWTSFHIGWIVPAVIIALLWKRSETTKRQIYMAAFALQLVVLVGAMYHFTYRYGVVHLAEPVVAVSRLRLRDRSLSFPLIEEEAAYIVSNHGRLYRIDLAQSRKVFIAQIPRPQPAEIGFPQMTLPNINWEYTSFFGFLQRIDEDELYFRFTHALSHGRWAIGVRINEESGQVAWQLLGTEFDVPITFPPGIDPRGIVQTVSPGGRVITGSPDEGLYRPYTVLIKSDGVKTAIDPLELVEWIAADHGWILVGTRRGGLIIATIKER